MQQLRLFLSVLLASILFSAAPAHADTYSISALTIDNKSFYGMDDSGHVVFNSGGTYFTFLNGSPAGTASTAPTFTWDYASSSCLTAPCSVTYSGRTVNVSQVSGSLDDIYLTAFGNPPQLVTQTDGISGHLAINGAGDIVFDSGTDDEWYEAFDLTASPVPEPRSLLLIATGALGLAAFALRRRQIAE